MSYTTPSTNDSVKLCTVFSKHNVKLVEVMYKYPLS